MAEIRKKSYGISLARVVCAIGIVVYHYFMHALADSPVSRFANGEWGSTFVFIFFMISGYVLLMNYPDPEPAGTFYKKRFLRLMPMYWMVYLVAFLDMSLVTSSICWGGEPWKIILSLLGIDGLLRGYTTTFYLCGEWFLGVIIICYLLYPLLVKCFRKLGIWLWVIAMAVAAAALQVPFFENRGHHNVMLCLAIFIAGMVIRRYSLLEKKLFHAISIVLMLAAMLLPLPVPAWAGDWAAALGLLSTLYVIGNAIGRQKQAAEEMKTDDKRRGSVRLCALIDFLDPLTYPVFLLHHMILTRYISAVLPQGIPQHLIVLSGSLLLTILFAWALKVVHERIMRCMTKNDC